LRQHTKKDLDHEIAGELAGRSLKEATRRPAVRISLYVGLIALISIIAGYLYFPNGYSEDIQIQKDEQIELLDEREKPKEILSKLIVNFGYRTDELPIAAYKNLDRLVTFVQLNSDYEIVIQGHTDDVGSHEYNRVLSQTRANMVKTYLVGKGVNPAKMIVIGMGEDNPLVPNTTPEGRAANRRVEIHLRPTNNG
jgi:outer membrane protein OmpA-like peptidoglycan-associated protein